MASSYPTKMDPVADLLASEHPVAYRVSFAQALGGATVGLLLSQMYYWSRSEKARSRGDNSFYMTQEEITTQTGLTRTETDTARRKLREAGVLIEEKRGIPMKIWYRLDKDRLYAILLQHINRSVAPPPPNLAGNLQDGDDEGTGNLEGNLQDWIQKTAAPTCRKPASKDAGNQQAITETTSETSPEITTTDVGAMPNASVVVSNTDQNSEDAVAALVTAGISPDAAHFLVAEHGADRCQRQLARLPYRRAVNRAAVLRRSIEGNWAPDPSQAKAEEEAHRTTERLRRSAEDKVRKDELRAAQQAEHARLEAIWKNLSTLEKEALMDEAWNRAIQGAAPPVRSVLERAAKSQEPPTPMAWVLIKRARMEILTVREQQI